MQQRRYQLVWVTYAARQLVPPFDVPGVTAGIDLNGTGSTAAVGINADGTIVSHYYNGHYHGFRYNQAELDYPLDYTCFPNTVCMGINSQSQIVGYCWDAYGYGLLYANQVLQLFWPLGTPETPGTPITEAFGINDAGEMVGLYWDPNTSNYRGFIMASSISGQSTPLDYPGLTATFL